VRAAQKSSLRPLRELGVFARNAGSGLTVTGHDHLARSGAGIDDAGQSREQAEKIAALDGQVEDLVSAQLLTDSGCGKNTQFPLVDLFRQSVYSRLAGYEDVNDAERLSQDPTFRPIGSEKIWDRGAALTLRLQSFETEMLAAEENFAGLARINREGDCLATKLRPGNVPSAEDWEELLLPEGPESSEVIRQEGFAHNF